MQTIMHDIFLPVKTELKLETKKFYSQGHFSFTVIHQPEIQLQQHVFEFSFLGLPSRLDVSDKMRVDSTGPSVEKQIPPDCAIMGFSKWVLPLVQGWLNVNISPIAASDSLILLDTLKLERSSMGKSHPLSKFRLLRNSSCNSLILKHLGLLCLI